MRRHSYTLVHLILIAAGVALCSCSTRSAAAVDPARQGWPTELHFSVSISQEDPQVEGHRLEPIRQYLQETMRMPVVVTGTSGYGAVIEAMRARKIEAATMGPFAYLIASEKAGAEAIATRGAPDGIARLYSGTLAVRADSPLHSVEDLVRHARELSISFVDPASASGNLVQRAYLDSLGLLPERDFHKVVFTLSHPTSALTLLAGKVDVAAVGETVMPALFRTGKLKPGEIRVLWVSPRIPEGPIAVRKDLPESFKKRLREVLLQMSVQAPDAYFNMTSKIFRERYRGTRFVSADDASFNPVRALARGAHNAQLLEE